MANIIKSSSGFLYSEDNWDDLSLLWDLSPNDPSRVALTSDSISLLPGAERTELLLTAPKDKGYVIQSQMEYMPSKDTEAAGSLFKSLTGSYIELEIRGDTGVSCQYSKIIIDEDYILDAKASADGVIWMNYGNTKMADMNKIGYYIESGENTDAIFKIKNCTMYKNNNVILNGFDRKNNMKLFDRNMNEITDTFYIKKKNSQMILDGTNLIYPIDYLKVQVSDRVTGDIYHEGVLTNVYGGDMYEYNYNVELYIDEVLLTNDMHDLGKVGEEKSFILKITNKESYPLQEKILKVSNYTIYNPGYKITQISFESRNDYHDSLKVSFGPGETRLFRLKISRDDSLTNIEDEYKFNIVLE